MHETLHNAVLLVVEDPVEVWKPKTKTSKKGQPLSNDLDERNDVVLDELPPEPERTPKARAKLQSPVSESSDKANPSGKYITLTTFCFGNLYINIVFLQRQSILFSFR